MDHVCARVRLCSRVCMATLYSAYISPICADSCTCSPFMPRLNVGLRACARVRLVKGSMSVMRRHGQQCNATTHCNHHPLVDYEWWRGTCGSKESECGVGVERGQEGSSAPWTAQRSLWNCSRRRFHSHNRTFTDMWMTAILLKTIRSVEVFL